MGKAVISHESGKHEIPVWLLELKALTARLKRENGHTLYRLRLMIWRSQCHI